MKCPFCKGSGRSPERGHNYRCENCDGTGKVLCDTCGELLELCKCMDPEAPRPHSEKCQCPKCEAWDLANDPELQTKHE
jgi:RecJ-like exonuclease